MHSRLATWFAGSTVWILLRIYCCVRKWTGLWSIRQSRYKHLREYLWCVSHKGQHEARRIFFLSFSSQQYVVVVQLQSPVQLFVTPWTSAWQALLSFTISLSLLTRMSIKSVMPSNHLILCHPLLLCLQSFPASEFFQMSQFFSSGGQSIRGSASASVLPVNNQDCFPLGWTGLMSSESKGLSRVFSNTKVQKHQFFSTQLSL